MSVTSHCQSIGLSAIFFFFFVGEFLSVSCLSVSCLLVSGRVTLRSAWASAQSDQSLHCPHEESLGP